MYARGARLFRQQGRASMKPRHECRGWSRRASGWAGTRTGGARESCPQRRARPPRPPARLVLHDVKQPAARQPVLAFASAAALAAVTVALAAPWARLPRRRRPDHITIAAHFVASNVLPRLSTRGSSFSTGPRSRISTWSSRPWIVSCPPAQAVVSTGSALVKFMNLPTPIRSVLRTSATPKWASSDGPFIKSG